jgi:transcriptional regulator with XRE-family HTH domain
MTAAQLRQWREQLKLTQREAAERLGCSPRSLQNWEAGKQAIPGYIAMAASAVSMNLPPYGSKKPL